MMQYEEALTSHPRWAQEPGAHLPEIESYAFSLVDSEERYNQSLPPLLCTKDALALLLDLAEGYRKAKDKITSAAHHAEYRSRCRVFVDYGTDKPETFQPEADFLQALFGGVCRALGAKGFTFTGGELSQVKAGLPEELAEDLDALKLPALPDEERLTAEDTAALFAGLTREGLISGPLRTFARHLGRLSGSCTNTPETALSWTGTKALFAYFAWRFSLYTQPGGVGYTIRVNALCRAFGIDERSRRNTIRPTLSKLRQEDRPPIRGSEKIDKVFQGIGI